MEKKGADASVEIGKRNKLQRSLSSNEFNVKRSDFSDWGVCDKCNFVTNKIPAEDEFAQMEDRTSEHVHIKLYKKFAAVILGIIHKIANIELSYNRLSANPAASKGVGPRQAPNRYREPEKVKPIYNIPERRPHEYAGKVDPELVKAMASGRGSGRREQYGSELPTIQGIENKWKT